MTARRARTLGAVAVIALAGLAAMPAATPAAKRKRGIDVSRFQGFINWKQVGQTKIRFAFVQASRGSGNDCTVAPDRCGRDRFYRRNYRRARANGLRVGPYHRAFADGHGPKSARRDARAEARLFLRRVRKLRERDLLPALDVEHPFGSLGKKGLRIWVRTWLRRVEARLGVRPIIYTNFSSWQATGDARGFARRGHRLWVANFDVNRPMVPAANWAGNGWSIWQYTSSGHVKGVSGHVDKNRLRVGFRKVSVGANRTG